MLFEICYESGHLLTDTMAMRVTDRKFIDVSSMMYSVHRMANESLGWHRTTAEQFARLGAHVYPSNLSTWHATSSSSLSGKVFWLTHHTSRFSGHYFLGVITTNLSRLWEALHSRGIQVEMLPLRRTPHCSLPFIATTRENI